MSRNKPTWGNSSTTSAGEPAAVYCRISQADDGERTRQAYLLAHRTAPHRTAPHRTAPHRTAPPHRDRGCGHRRRPLT
ncbi:MULTISPECIES: hypothetical protein [unclassified Streptomyces]|uniref:hypothetical protein n=1 Tax=unclassified Streptomyces TaxID=2593676 RepID=UPI0035DB80E7